MYSRFSLLWTWNRTIDRLPYLRAGVLFFLVKFVLDWTIATQLFRQSWSLTHYFIWPNDRTLRILDLTDPDRSFALAMTVASLPFIWIGIVLTLHRLRAAGLPLALVAFFFVPLVNLVFFLVLAVLKTRNPSLTGDFSAPNVPQRRPLHEAHQSLTHGSRWRSGFVALLITVPLSVIGVFVGAEVLQSYGFSLFLGGPFVVGMMSVLLFGFSRPQPFGSCLLVALAAVTATGLGLFAGALEGFICLLMAAPIVLALALAGALVGYAIQTRPWHADQTSSILLLVLLTLPGLMAAEAANEPELFVRAVRTEVIIDAPPEKVWPHVIAFPPLPEPSDWLFQAGIAYPQRAEIQGYGIGAVRRCVFSTGDFVEPIEVWDPPSLLRFHVAEQPAPMHEWSPYHTHPPHLDHYLVSRQGQFLLEALPNGRTRLEGTTWYTNRMWPALYWNLWSDSVIQRIHRRVLVHIQELADSADDSSGAEGPNVRDRRGFTDDTNVY